MTKYSKKWRRAHSAIFASLVCLASTAGCSTLAESADPAGPVPNAQLGPFRSLRQTELGNSRSAPYALRGDAEQSRDVAVVDSDGDPTTLEVVIYAAERRPGTQESPTVTGQRLVRYTAEDGRSAARQGTVVLEADEPWEGGVVAQPSVLVLGGVHRIYYATAGGIASAEGPSGGTFVKAGLVLQPRQTGWDAGAVPESPGVIQREDGSLCMFYSAKGQDGTWAIGQATSMDGRSWQRSLEAVLRPRSEEGEVALGGPFALRSTSALGRRLRHVYFHVESVAGKSTIALASRASDDAPLQRSVGPVFGSAGTLNPTEPCVLCLLYTSPSPRDRTRSRMPSSA